LGIGGQDLISLILTRLPFPVPDPVIDNKMSKSDKPYEDVLLSEMILKLRQGVGRLIRRANIIIVKVCKCWGADPTILKHYFIKGLSGKLFL
jgi:hypothetical protein